MVDACLVGAVVPRHRKPRAHFIAGGPGSGKSELARSGQPSSLGAWGSFANVDPDVFKEVLPEYNLAIAEQSADATAFVHAECSIVAKNAARVAIASGTDVLF